MVTCRSLLIWSLLCVFLALLPPIVESGQEWKNHVNHYDISAGPFHVPFISDWLGPMTPLPMDTNEEDFLVGRLQDYFFSKPEEDWTAYQPQWRVSYQFCPFGIFVTS